MMSEDAPVKPFGKAVAEVYVDVKKSVEGKESIDKSVREQVASDLDKLIEKNKNLGY